MKIVHKTRYVGIPEEVWVRYLTDGQLRQVIRGILKGQLNLNRKSNERLELLLREAEGQPSMQDWLARCLDLLAAANDFTLEPDPTKPNTLMFVPRHDQAAS